MADPKPFQRATVNAAYRQLKKEGGRFLVADEVGLGKTLIAQQVMKRMMEKQNRPLVVVYMCSNLTIRAQNRTKLLEILPKDERASAYADSDRLTLLNTRPRPQHPNLHLYCFTPETSLPTRSGRSRGGVKDERALAYCLVKQLWPELTKGKRRAAFKGQATTYWTSAVRTQREVIKQHPHLVRKFERAVRQQFEIGKGKRSLPVLGEIESGLELIGGLRNALAVMAIETFDPDLVIFDEFQKFRDLIEDKTDGTAHWIQRRLRGEGSGKKGSLLLLSATPYDLLNQHTSEQDGSHHEQFFELVEFLYLNLPRRNVIRPQCVERFKALQTEMLQEAPDMERVRELRAHLERDLSRVMARTERCNHDDGWSDLNVHSFPAPLHEDDLRIFRHLSEAMRQWHPGAAVPYWSSIPLPAQTMGQRYEGWKHARKDGSTDGVPCLKAADRDQFLPLPVTPHPRYRALTELIGTAGAELPWLQPSVPWWPLDGGWKTGEAFPGKVLLFSRFRAVPQAVSSLLSYELECRLMQGGRLTHEDLTKRRLLQPRPNREALLAYFHPCPWLVKHTDPLQATDRSIVGIRKSIASQLKVALDDLGVAVEPKTVTGNRPIWRLLVMLEEKDGIGGVARSAWWFLNVLKHEQEDRSGIKDLMLSWYRASKEEIHSITEREFDRLVEFAFHSPGVALTRALYRHWPEVVEEEGLKVAVKLSWRGLRAYLDSPLFVKALKGDDSTYPDAIMHAVRDGNLEAVMDEQLWLLKKLYSIQGKDLAEGLLAAMSLQTGTYNLHELDPGWEDRFSLRCHMAMPFTDAKTAATEGEEGKLRPDELRKAFNSPFWPYVLSTTSVGQEGLDFHVWCSNLVHWDLPRNPVDLEQREGRVQRFAGHSIRKEIWRHLGGQVFNEVARHGSVWSTLEHKADKVLADDSGLRPWWVLEGAEARRYMLDVPLSEQTRQLVRLQKFRTLYRMVLGQANQEDLLGRIATTQGASLQRMRDFSLNLSPWFQKSGTRQK